MSVSTKPPSGTRDFLPDALRARRGVIEVIQRVYESYGFAPLETPAMERLEVLTGKYGDEGDQLIFKVLKRGEKLPALTETTRPDDLADLAMRYDLTVPLARVVAAHAGTLPRFFKRYQIQTVWRADRPQRGRFREFFQCDVDFTGTASIVAEFTVISAVTDALNELGFTDFTVRINDRRILEGLMEVTGVSPQQRAAALVAIDKLDKIGSDGVTRELEEQGLAPSTVRALVDLFGGTDDSTNDRARLAALASRFDGASAVGAAGCSGLAELFALFDEAPPAAGTLRFDVSLARGLSYYTGAIFEIQVPGLAGSMGGGGRYDGLIGMFRGADIPAVGFSLGLERILVVMEERGMLPPAGSTSDLMVARVDATTTAECLSFARAARAAGLRVEVFPELAKLGKQLAYAESTGIRYVAILGSAEVELGTVNLKDLTTGEQRALPLADAPAAVREIVVGPAAS